jgi:N,N'-diacetyllegionaminate synthase
MEPEVIVEIGNSHEGSLGIACSFIDMAASAGATAVKFQLHMARFESTLDEPFRVNMGQQDSNRFEYWERTSFDEREWCMLADHAQQRGLEFLCTPFSREAAELLETHKLVSRWKIGSGDATNLSLLEFIAGTEKDLILSTGLLNWNELLQVRDFLQARGAWERTTLMYCVSKYPTPLSDLSLAGVQELRSLGRPVGFSDHTGDLTASMFMLANSVHLIEVHMTPHRDFFGPDTSSSLLPAEIKELVDFSRKVKILRDGTKLRDCVYSECVETAKIFRKGLYWKASKPPKSIVSMEDLSFKKPTVGLDALKATQLVGLELERAVVEGNPVQLSDLRNDIDAATS